MAKQQALIIVESPAKIKTLQKFLGPGFKFESSIGHIRDLPAKEFGIDLKNDFEPTYVTMPDKEGVISKLQKAAAQCDVIYLCPDPDREGEAIAWHIAQILPPNTVYKRVTFNSITKEAVLKALQSPREIDLAMVNAQQARRLLDRIVGYKISPILNRRIQRGRSSAVSAGRVQSAALKLVVDREKEIDVFKPTEYWNLAAFLALPSSGAAPFKAGLYTVDGLRVEKEPVAGKELFLIGSKEVAEAVLARMRRTPYSVISVDKKEKKRNPVPPFITSTLQQEASRHYGFGASKTMSIAQTLYEGVDIGKEGHEGLITYMRTDSVRIAPEAVEEAKSYITSHYGQEYLASPGKAHASKGNVQDAHEAIRPTTLVHTPESLRSFLSRDQFALYQLIWQRFVASQMAPAIYDTVAANIDAGDNIVVRATGSHLKFRGFLAVYEEKRDDEGKEEEEILLPPLNEGQTLDLRDLTAEQAFTRPPPRFSEASLVKELEKSGIGRPSTYATIMNKIQSREYTIKEGGRLKPTELGRIIAQWLEDNFKIIMNLGFTAAMEDDLEHVAEKRKDWKKLMGDFWEQFLPTLEAAEGAAFVPKVLTDVDCPDCGSKLQKIWFKSKYFYGCSRYPECSFRAPIEELSFDKGEYAEDFDWEQPCPKCGLPMKVRHGKYGAFLGCTGYPECRGIVNIPKKGEKSLPTQNLPSCPAEGCPGQMVARKSRFGKIFFSCSTYPDCDVIVNSLGQLSEKYAHHPRTPYVSKKAKGKAPAKGKSKASEGKKAKKAPAEGASTRGGALTLSPALASLLETKELSRPQVTKKIWEYIKAHNLQNPANKREIRPDAALAAAIGTSEVIDMFKLPALLSKQMQ